uniref:Uncharacterized protein n=2 Tax=unclassified Caudoviricetes TaxID=2788787 RepID=A0A8S5M110_9CAUD|nr:MAG TPA: hypothetical protein [Myoviridae sp. ctyFl19]DAE06173.1 MAG TPA: hypothetical protein [Myoviridae sp. ctdSc46]
MRPGQRLEPEPAERQGPLGGRARPGCRALPPGWRLSAWTLPKKIDTFGVALYCAYAPGKAGRS